MVKYTIDYRYRTGNSFETTHENETLECEWSDIEVAKLNLRRIKEQNLWYRYNPHAYRFDDDVIPDRPLWLPPNDELGAYENEKHVLILKMDNNNDWKIKAPWCGYFEKLISAKITIVDEDMEINFED